MTILSSALPDPPPGGWRVLIVQPEFQDGPAFLLTWLMHQGIEPCTLVVERGDEVPTSAAGWHAVAVMGGPMSVNDPLPFLPRCVALLQDAIALGVPVLGHCLGGQLLANALSAVVEDNPEPEIGWFEVQRQEHVLAQAWLGDAPTFTPFHWHFQRFGLPPGAVLLAGNAVCGHQAFAWGPHLGMQFHIEVDAEKLGRWADEAPEAGSLLASHRHVMTPSAMRSATARHLAASQTMAARIYRRWLTLAAMRLAG